MSKLLSICLNCILVISLFLPMAYSQDIHEATKTGDIEAVKRLIAEDSQLIFAKDPSKRTPLHWAAMHGHMDIMPLVYAKEALEATDFAGYTPLFLAAMSEKEAVKWLLENGANVDARKRFEKSTPLHWTAEQGTPEVIEVLLAHGADLEARNAVGTTPLMIAAKAGKTENVSILIKHGAQINSLNMSKTSALMFGAAFRHSEIVKLLLDAKADLSLTSMAGQTALHLAAMRDNEETVTLLLNAGAEKSLSDKKGKTPLDYAKEKGHEHLLKLLE